MKNPEPVKSLMPSLFQIAANIDDSPAVSRPKPLAGHLPPDSWPFSRERLERALQARMLEIRRQNVPMNRVPKPTRRAMIHLSEIADASVKAA